MKTNELMGAALDWAVAKCEGYFDAHEVSGAHFLAMWKAEGHGVHWTHSSTDWAEGGPIIEREKIDVFSIANGTGWCAQSDVRVFNSYGPTPLIAAMRCHVASELGDEVDVPTELLEDGQAIGIDNDGNVICWDATKQEPYNSGENDAND